MGRFSSPPLPDRLWGPSSLPSNWYWGLFPPGLNRPGRVADHSPPSSVEVKSAWSYTSTLPIRLHGVVLGKAQGQLNLLPVSTLDSPSSSRFMLPWILKANA
jgi:hypothetical protein